MNFFVNPLRETVNNIYLVAWLKSIPPVGISGLLCCLADFWILKLFGVLEKDELGNDDDDWEEELEKDGEDGILVKVDEDGALEKDDVLDELDGAVKNDVETGDEVENEPLEDEDELNEALIFFSTLFITLGFDPPSKWWKYFLFFRILDYFLSIF